MNVYKAENTLLYEHEGKVVAMLQMIPYTSSIGKTMYLYGVCTSEAYRGQGFSSKLIQESFTIAKDRGCISVILMPDGDDLFKFYAKFGFVDSLRCNTKTIQTGLSRGITAKRLSHDDIDNLLLTYRKNTTGGFYIERTTDFFTWQIDIYAEGAIKYEKDGTILGYSFGYRDGDNLIIDEIVSDDIEECISAHENTKVTYNTFGNERAFGMIKMLSNQKPLNGYINLLFN